MSTHDGTIYAFHLALMIIWSLTLNIYAEKELRRIGYHRWRSRILFPLWFFCSLALPIGLASTDLLSGLWLYVLGLIFTFGVRDLVRSHYKEKAFGR